MANDFYGPCLPPGFKVPSEDNEKGKSESEVDEENPGIIGPGNGKVPILGPQMPEHLKRSYSDDEDNSTIGPKVPRFIMEKLASQSEESDQPSEPDEESDNDEFIGPMPSTEPNKEYNISSLIDKRAEKMKEKLLNKDKAMPMEREEWMTELPVDVGKKIVGVGPSRGFSTKPHVGEYDREGWTQTPGKAQKSRGPSKHDLSSTLAQQARDKQQEAILKDYTKGTKQESLMDMHKKKLKEKKKADAESGMKPRRKEFDRDAELAILQFDPTKTRKTIQNSRNLPSRFSSGSQKFL